MYASYLCLPSTKIGGGEDASPGEFPYSVSLRKSIYGHVCGGAILSPNLVVTAAVCTDPLNLDLHQIVAGSLKRTEDPSWQQIRTAERIVVHPGYAGLSPIHDVSLIFLAEEFDFNENISSIDLPSLFLETFPNPIVLSGGGNVQYGEPLIEDLQKVSLDTYSDSKCAELLELEVMDELLCSGADEGGRGGCQGDAGSPIVTLGNNSYIAAVLSHFPCPTPDCCGIPGPTGESPELAFYVDWILEQSKIYGGGL